MAGAPLLTCEGLTKAYGGLVALRGLDLAVEPGELFAVIGPNGAGKTTLFDVLSGITRATAGVARLAGQEIQRLRPHRICRLGLARTFQTPVAFASQTVLRNALVGAVFGRAGAGYLPLGVSREAGAAAREALAACGLDGHEERRAGELTVLGRKRLMIATALACRPRVLLLDEPFGGLNAGERAELIALCERLRGGGLTILMIEHIIHAVQALADRVLVLHHGERLAEGRPGDVLRDRRVVEVYLGERAERRAAARAARSAPPPEAAAARAGDAA
jgi:branched-chain amino acid transport system ATP-binding protein